MNVLNLALQYNTLDIVENGYGISLRDMITFAQETYKDCTWFMPRNPDDKEYLKSSMDTLSKVHKAVAIIQFKLEGQLHRPPSRIRDGGPPACWTRIDFDEADGAHRGSGSIPSTTAISPPSTPPTPTALTEAEAQLMLALRRGLPQQRAAAARMCASCTATAACTTATTATCCSTAASPWTRRGNSWPSPTSSGRSYSGQGVYGLRRSRRPPGLLQPRRSPEGRRTRISCGISGAGGDSPLFGRDKITTFERYFVADRETWAEEKNAYYRHIQTREACEKILAEFGLPSRECHIVNGHVPVRAKKGESPVKADGRLMVIDGGFCRAYHDTTGIAGYTLIYNSYGLKLVSHESFAGQRPAIEQNKDILTTTDMFEKSQDRRKVRDTDTGREIAERIGDLTALLRAYRQGWIPQK